MTDQVEAEEEGAQGCDEEDVDEVRGQIAEPCARIHHGGRGLR